MAQAHAVSGQVVSARPLGAALAGARSTALLKAAQLEVMRLVLHAGQTLREHAVPGEITLQCLEGEVELTTPDATHRLVGGDFIHLGGGTPHALMARLDTSLLLTVCLHGAVAP